MGNRATFRFLSHAFFSVTSPAVKVAVLKLVGIAQQAFVAGDGARIRVMSFLLVAGVRVIVAGAQGLTSNLGEGVGLLD